MKLNGPEVWNWTVQKYESGRSKSVKVDGPNIWNSESGRSWSMKAVKNFQTDFDNWQNRLCFCLRRKSLNRFGISWARQRTDPSTCNWLKILTGLGFDQTKVVIFFIYKSWIDKKRLFWEIVFYSVRKSWMKGHPWNIRSKLEMYGPWAQRIRFSNDEIIRFPGWKNIIIWRNIWSSTILNEYSMSENKRSTRWNSISVLPLKIYPS